MLEVELEFPSKFLVTVGMDPVLQRRRWQELASMRCLLDLAFSAVLPRAFMAGTIAWCDLNNIITETALKASAP